MNAHSHHMHHGHDAISLNRTAWSATLHCLTGCAIGEVLGMIIGTALGWGNAETIALAVVLAFLFGYALTLLPLVKAMSFGAAAKLALVAVAAFPLNRWLIARGKGHAVVHAHH